MCASKSSVAVLVLAATLTASPVLAAEKKADPNKEQLRRLQQVQRQLEQDKAAALGELEVERKKADGEAQRASALKRDLHALRSARDAVAARLAESEAKLAETGNELRKTQEAQRAAEAESKRLQSALAGEKQEHVACVEHGQQLSKVSGEVLALYEKKSCFDSALQHEPFTGLKRVEIENAVEDLRDKLEAQRSGS
jgi:chromosome segregation ATPase